MKKLFRGTSGSCCSSQASHTTFIIFVIIVIIFIIVIFVIVVIIFIIVIIIIIVIMTCGSDWNQLLTIAALADRRLPYPIMPDAIGVGVGWGEVGSGRLSFANNPAGLPKDWFSFWNGS